MTKVKIENDGKCLSCGKMNHVLKISIGRTEQAMVDIELCHKCLFDIAVKSDLKILEKEEAKKKEMKYV